MEIWWYINKKKYLQQVKYCLLKVNSHRKLSSTIVISIIQYVIDTDRENILKNVGDITFNPLNDSPLILHILENYHLLKPYKTHRDCIRKILCKYHLH